MSDPSCRFQVVVDDNFHAMDPEERYTDGVFPSEETAVDRARAIIDTFLSNQFVPTMSADELYHIFCAYGECPQVLPECGFSPYAYARIRCRELCEAD